MNRLPAPLKPDRRRADRPAPIPLRPDPTALREANVTSLVRATVALGMNALDPSTLPGDYARRTWPGDRDLPLVLRAAVSPASIANTPALATVAAAFLQALVPQSAGADLLQRGLGLQFDGAASISVPSIAVPAADFVGEGQPIPTTQGPTSPGARLERHKLAVIATATSEMLRSPSAEQLIRQVLVESTGPALDRALFSVNPAGPDRPAGLLFGIAPLPPTVSLVDNLVAVVSAVAPVAANGGTAIVCAPVQSVAINLLLPRQPPFAVLTSATLAPGTLIAVALNALVSAVEGPPQIDGSRDAVVHQETAPRQDIGGGVMATPLHSMFQSDSISLRLRWPLCWGLRSPQGVAWIQGA
jgi:hypothetical protein